MRALKHSLLETSLLAAAVVSLLVPGLAGLALLGGLLGAWLWRFARPRERWLVDGLGLLALGLLAWGFQIERTAFEPERKRQAIERDFSDLWAALDAAAESAARSVASQEDGPHSVRELFDRLTERARRPSEARLTLLLVDAGGAPVAWAGAGLLHELEEEPLPPRGRGFRLGFQSATLFSVAPVPGRPASRLVAGRSLPTTDLPERDRLLGPIRWTVFRPGDVVPARLVEIDAGPGPNIALEDWSARSGPYDRWTSRARRWAAAALALALLGLAFIRARREPRHPVGPLVAGAALAAALAARLDLVTGACLVVAAWLAVRAWRAPSDRTRAWLPPPWLRGLAGTGAVALFALGVQASRPDLDLGSALSPDSPSAAWRLTVFAASVAWLVLQRRPVPAGAEPRLDPRSPPWAWLAFALLLAAAAVHDQQLALLAVLLGAGGVAAAIWASLQPRPLTPVAGAILCLLAALLAGVCWETGHRRTLKHHLKSTVLPGLASPAAGEVERLRLGLERHFSELDLDSLVLPNPAGLDPQDLGMAIWSGSPLAVRGALSAVTARPFDGAPSTFSYGLPLTSEGAVDWAPTRWRRVEESSPEAAALSGATRFLHGGRPWADIWYTLLMRPGFQLSRRPIDSLAADLLRGGPGPFRPEPDLIEPALYGSYRPSGEPLEPLWPGAEPPLELLLSASGSAIAGPEGRAFGFAARDGDTIQVLVLPALGPVAALERVGTHAVAVLLVIAGGVLFGWLTALERLPTVASLAPVLRSYSKRMLLAASLLLLVPVLLLNTFALGVLTEHLREEQRVAGQSALDSAQRVLGEYVQTLEPGFGVESILDDELLSWLSRVIHHEINLYWGSSVYASSRGELFSAGVLPKRIPGEIYAELALGGAPSAERVNQAGSTDYLELYAPLSVPGQPDTPRRLFLSVPLLAQQVETAAELGSLRRKVLLATTALVLILLAIGTRLARGFTVPLMQIVSGTQRIAAGARSLDLQPADEELATLVEAIDQMALRISEGRQHLMQEKALVERVIDNVNSGVVSVDDQGRVALINQAARELLHAEVGDALAEVLERNEHLAPVAGFLATVGAEPRLETIQLPDAEAEWSLVWVPLPGEGEPTALLVVEDVTEVLRGQRLQAWAEMARIIAHEIKNPLTPIRLSAEHMREVRASRPQEFDRVFERCTANILEQVDELQQISSEFSAYSRLPKIDLRDGDLGEAVRKIVEGYSAAGPEGVRLTLESEGPRLSARFDARLIGRALRNLIENALRATANGRGVEVAVGRRGARTSIRVLDNGPGVSPEILPRIFDPYFSTHDSGTGLGLAIARRIAEEHGGGIQARNRPTGGLEVELWLPAGQS